MEFAGITGVRNPFFHVVRRMALNGGMEQEEMRHKKIDFSQQGEKVSLLLPD